jgi:hypothetical protein
MVTTEDLDRLQRQNFGIRALNGKIDADLLVREIRRYDRNDAAEVSRRIRSTGGLESVVDDAVSLYNDVIEEFRTLAVPDPAEENRAMSEYLRWMTLAVRRKQSEYEALLANSPTLRLRNRIGRIPLMEKVLKPLARWARRDERVNGVR